MERECNKCIHHTSGMCDSWDCKMQTVEGLVKETREKAITEFAEKLIRHLADWQMSEDDVQIKYIITQACEGVEEIAEQLKGE